MGLKGRKSKAKVQSQDQYTPDNDSIYSEEAQKQQKPVQLIKKETLKLNKMHDSSRGSELTIRNNVNPSMSYIKQAILNRAPDMRNQIDVLDDNVLRQIYQSLVLPNLQGAQIPEEAKGFNMEMESMLQQRKQTQQMSDIQRMKQKILETVPHMKDDLQQFEDGDIKQIWESMGAGQKHKEDYSKTQQQNPHQQRNLNGNYPTNAISNNQNFSMSQKIQNKKGIRDFMYEKIPEMRDQLEVLSDEDLYEVYQQYAQKQKNQSIQSRNQRPRHNVYQKGSLNSNRTVNLSQNFNGEYQDIAFDPLKKFQNQNMVKLQQNFRSNSTNSHHGKNNNLNFTANAHMSGDLNRQNKFPQNFGGKAPSSRSQYGMAQNYAFPGNDFQFHSFHNNKRVKNVAQGQNLTRTMIIFHTMQPGFVPQTNNARCRCPCCSRSQQQLYDPNALSSFMQQIMHKYSARK